MLSRRDLAKVAAAAGLSASRGFGQASGPKASRFIVFFTPNGTVPARWRPTGGGSTFTFEPGTILEPLAAHAADLVVVEGLNFFGASNHEGGMAAMLTGTPGVMGESRGMSVDQFVAARLAAPTRFPSLELGVATSAWGGSTQTRMSYAGPGVLVTPDDQPARVLERLFGPAMPVAGADVKLERQKAVIALNRRQLLRLRAESPEADQKRLDQHLGALDRLEQRLAPGSTPMTAGCARPTFAPIANHGAYSAFPEVGAAQLSLAVAALACDLTRVVSLQWSHTVSPVVFSWLGQTEAHHELSHMADQDAAGVGRFVTAERWFATQFGLLLDALKATPDPLGGGSLFDTSLVLWCKEMGDSRLHVCEAVPMVLSGKANGALRLGRYLRTGGEPHQKLLVSLCHLMGLDNASFGDASKSTGPLAGLL
ncbi:MAG: DUF1552 domain-containing protein [Myxococcaceae bacterium]|nr:DUF1552 domain-containing protein [Myxococcaceae bacterium]